MCTQYWSSFEQLNANDYVTVYMVSASGTAFWPPLEKYVYEDKIASQSRGVKSILAQQISAKKYNNVTK